MVDVTEEADEVGWKDLESGLFVNLGWCLLVIWVDDGFGQTHDTEDFVSWVCRWGIAAFDQGAEQA